MIVESRPSRLLDPRAGRLRSSPPIGLDDKQQRSDDEDPVRDHGRWPLEVAYHETSHLDLGERVGEPSRWVTHRAMRVLRWAGRQG